MYNKPASRPFESENHFSIQLLPKQCIQTINAKSEKIARQEEGAMYINMAFASAEEVDGEFAYDADGRQLVAA